MLRGGLSTLAYALPPTVRVFEVDSRPALARKRALLDAALPPYWRSSPARPRFVEGGRWLGRRWLLWRAL